MFSTPELPNPSAIVKLANNLPRKPLLGVDKFGEIKFPIRTVPKMLLLINNNEASKISPIDWLMLFLDSRQWVGVHENEVESSCLLLWTVITKNSIATQIACNAILNDFESETSYVPKHMLDALMNSDELSQRKLKLPQKLTIVKFILANKWWKITRKAMDSNKSISDYFDYNDLFLSNRVRKQLISKISSAVDLEKAEYVEWFVTCIGDLDDKDLKPVLSSFATLYNPKNEKSNKKIKYGPDNIPKKISEWLGQNLSLEKQVKLSLSSWVKTYISSISSSPHYSQFEQIIRVLTKPENSEALKFTKQNPNQLLSRMHFFKNYQNQMTDLIVYLPKESYEVVSKNLPKSQKFIRPFGDNSKSEVGVFKIGGAVCVEFFRSGPKRDSQSGVWESCFYKDDSKSGQSLLKASFSSLTEILAFKPIFKHDHKKYWQVSLAHMIHKQFEIKLDSHVKEISYGKGKSKKEVVDGIPLNLTNHEEAERLVDFYLKDKERYEYMNKPEFKPTVFEDSMNSFNIRYTYKRKTKLVKVHSYISLDEKMYGLFKDGEVSLIRSVELPEVKKVVFVVHPKKDDDDNLSDSLEKLKGVGLGFQSVIGEIEVIEEI
jgi:hypothetical protein